MIKIIAKKAQIPALVMICLAALLWLANKYERKLERQSPQYFESAIQVYERQDALTPPPQGAIVFIGSSSIRIWKDIQADLNFGPIIARGFGGAHVQHVRFNIERIALNYKPAGIMIYAGENDLAGGESVQHVVDDLVALVRHIKQYDASIKVGIMLVKPTPLWREKWDHMNKVNQRLLDLAKDNGFFTVDTASVLFSTTADDSETPALGPYYAQDQLHLNKAGYARWSELMNRRLHAQFPQHRRDQGAP